MRTQVCIIGGGPSGLLLSQLLHREGIDTMVLERRSREHVLSRIRAGVLEDGSVALLRQAGVDARLDCDGIVHGGVNLASRNRGFRVDIKALTGRTVTVYGQTEVTADLYAARDEMGGTVIHEVENVTPGDIDRDAPFVTYNKEGRTHRIDCDFIAGCDGFHGVSRKAIPRDRIETHERAWPFGWLGILSETPPVVDELIYAGHDRGFALCSMRHANLSRYYVQCSLDDRVEDWSDDRFWDELRRRIPEDASQQLVTGPSIEKSIAPLRSFVAEPMAWGRLFLVGDAAHIVPPTGAKGLNLAFSDVHYLFDALLRHYGGEAGATETYAPRALARVWKAMRFSWWMTSLLHRFPDQTAFDRRIQDAGLAWLEDSEEARREMAVQYVGMPY